MEREAELRSESRDRKAKLCFGNRERKAKALLRDARAQNQVLLQVKEKADTLSAFVIYSRNEVFSILSLA